MMNMNKITQITFLGSNCSHSELDFLINFFSTMRQQKMVNGNINGNRNGYSGPIFGPTIPSIPTQNIPKENDHYEEYEEYSENVLWGNTPPTSEESHESKPNAWGETNLLSIMRNQERESATEKELQREEDRRVDALPTCIKSFCGKKECSCFYNCRDKEDPCRTDHELIDDTQIFIGNLPKILHFDTIRLGLSNRLDETSKGKDITIKRTYIPYDNENKVSLGHGFMTFFCHADAVVVADIFNDMEFFDQKLYINFSPKKSRSRSTSEESSEEHKERKREKKPKPRRYQRK